MIVLGSIFTLAGIYEFFSGHKVGDLLSVYADSLPGVARWVIDHLDNMPLVYKTGGGPAVMALGMNILKNNPDSQEAPES